MKYNTFIMEDALAAIIDYRGKTPKKSEKGIPTLSAKTVRNNFIDYSNCYFISPEEYKRFMVRGLPKKGDILLTTEAPLGMVAKLDRDDIAVAQRLLTLRGKENILDNDYLLFYLQSPIGQHLLKSHETGTTVTGIKQAVFRKLEISLPAIEDQRRIAAILSDINYKIQLNTAINENLEQLIAAYYAEIFKDCEYSATISDYADRIFSGGTPTTSKGSYWNGGFKWLSSGETSQKFIVNTEKTITQQGVDNSSTRLASKYDTVIASAGQGHTRGQTSMLLTDSYVNQSIIVVDSGKVYMPFIFWTLCGRYEELRVISNSNSIRGSLTTKMISSFSLPKADIKLISRFSELAWSAIYEIEKNSNETVRLTALRDALLPKLMSGEIDVSQVKI